MTRRRKDRNRRKLRKESTQALRARLVRNVPDLAGRKLELIESTELGMTRLSEQLAAFAAPLLDVAHAAHDIDLVRTTFDYAAAIWNAAGRNDALGEGYLARLRETTARLDPAMREVLDAMIEDRRTRFADDPRLVADIVVVDRGETYSITVTAVMTESEPGTLPTPDDEAP